MLSICLTALFICSADEPAPRIIADFELPDSQAQPLKLSHFRDRSLVVVVFLGTKCPLSRMYAARLRELAAEYASRGAQFIAIDPNAGDSPTEVARFAADHDLGFPILLDECAAVADKFGATRQLEVFVLDSERRVRYRGRIDDQYSPGVRRSAPSREDLRLALDELLCGPRSHRPDNRNPRLFDPAPRRPRRTSPRSPITATSRQFSIAIASSAIVRGKSVLST